MLLLPQMSLFLLLICDPICIYSIYIRARMSMYKSRKQPGITIFFVTSDRRPNVSESARLSDDTNKKSPW